MLKVTTVVVVTTQQWRGLLEFTTEIPFMLVTTTRYVAFHKWYSWTRGVHFAVLLLILEHWFHQTAVARVASVSARVRRKSWNKSKKRNEGGRVGQKNYSALPFLPFLLTSLKLSCSNSNGNACYAAWSMWALVIVNVDDWVWKATFLFSRLTKTGEGFGRWCCTHKPTVTITQKNVTRL